MVQIYGWNELLINLLTTNVPIIKKSVIKSTDWFLYDGNIGR